MSKSSKFFKHFEEVDDYLCIREKESKIRNLRDCGGRGFYRRLGDLFDSFCCGPQSGDCRCKKDSGHGKGRNFDR